MKPDNHFLELVELYIEEALAPEEDAELVRILSESDEFRQIFQELLAANMHLTDAFGPAQYPEAFRNGVIERIRARGHASDFAARTVREIRAAVAEREWPAATRTGRISGGGQTVGRWGLALPAAAAALILIAAHLFNQHQVETMPARILATLTQATPGMTIQRGDTRITAVAGTGLQEGDTLLVPAKGNARLQYVNEATMVDMVGDTRITIRDAGGAKQIEMQQGTLLCEVAPQPAGSPFTITSPRTQATVLGTKFTLSYIGGLSRLAVERGRVQIAKRDGTDAVIVEKGQEAAMGADGVLDDFEDSEEMKRWCVGGEPAGCVKITAERGGERPGQVLRLDYSVGEESAWGWAQREWTPGQDWSRFAGISFWFCGQGKGAELWVEVVDNADERFVRVFQDDKPGWQRLDFPWSDFHRRTDWQPTGAPDDGFTLTAVRCISFIPRNGTGWCRFDDLTLFRKIAMNDTPAP